MFLLCLQLHCLLLEGRDVILNLLKSPKGNEMEPSKERCSINIVKSKKPAFSSTVLPSFQFKEFINIFK